MSNREVLIIGASTKKDRYAYLAAELLLVKDYQITLVGANEDVLFGHHITTTPPPDKSFDTVTMYISPKWQQEYIDYIVGTKPGRVIFNPGTENPSSYERLEAAGIEVLEACTLVMLRTGQF
jgi:predicted CoA-binding protein